MTTLIIGGNGFVGSRTVRAFARAGHDVASFGPRMEPDLLADLPVVHHLGSITEAADLDRVLAETKPDLVISFAAHGEGDAGLSRSGELAAAKAMAVNVAGLHAILAASVARGVPRVLWASSTTVFGPPELYSQERVDEDARTQPSTFYGMTKVLAEELSGYFRRRYDLDVSAIRLPLIFGPGYWYRGAASQISDMVRAAATGGSYEYVSDGQPFDLMHVDDAADAFLKASEAGCKLADRYHVNGFTTTYDEVAACLSELVPSFSPRLKELHESSRYPLVSVSRFQTEIGFSPKFDLRSTLAAAIREERGLNSTPLRHPRKEDGC